MGEALQGISETGYQSIELCARLGTAPHVDMDRTASYYTEIKQKVTDYGLVIESLAGTGGIEFGSDNFGRVIEVADLLGAPAIAIGSGGKSDDQESESNDDELLESAEELLDESGDLFLEDTDEEDLQDADQDSPQELEIANLKDQLLRSAAEFENLKRRTIRDVENAHIFGTENLISDLLPIIDSLEKAIESALDVEGAEAMVEGVELSLKLFMDSLGRNGLNTVDPLGEPFDPSLHEALAVVPNENAEPNSVMEVIQKGFTLNDRLVRAAKVVVVKEEKS